MFPSNREIRQVFWTMPYVISLLRWIDTMAARFPKKKTKDGEEYSASSFVSLPLKSIVATSKIG